MANWKACNDGDHYFFAGDCARGANKLGNGVDLPHMVPLPGQAVPGMGRYTLVQTGHPVQLPAWVKEKAGEARPRDEISDVAICEWDLPTSIYIEGICLKRRLKRLNTTMG